MKALEDANAHGDAKAVSSASDDLAATVVATREQLSTEEQRVLNHITARSMMRADDTVDISEFASDVVDGMRLRMETGKLGLEKVLEA